MYLPDVVNRFQRFNMLLDADCYFIIQMLTSRNSPFERLGLAGHT